MKGSQNTNKNMIFCIYDLYEEINLINNFGLKFIKKEDKKIKKCNG